MLPHPYHLIPSEWIAIISCLIILRFEMEILHIEEIMTYGVILPTYKEQFVRFPSWFTFYVPLLLMHITIVLWRSWIVTLCRSFISPMFEFFWLLSSVARSVFFVQHVNMHYFDSQCHVFLLVGIFVWLETEIMTLLS